MNSLASLSLLLQCPPTTHPPMLSCFADEPVAAHQLMVIHNMYFFLAFFFRTFCTCNNMRTSNCDHQDGAPVSEKGRCWICTDCNVHEAKGINTVNEAGYREKSPLVILLWVEGDLSNQTQYCSTLRSACSLKRHPGEVPIRGADNE